MTKSVTVLGGGRVGGVMAQELASYPDLSVTVVDRDADRLRQLAELTALRTAVADLSDQSAIESVIESCDLVVSAVPSFLGFETCKTAIACGKNIVDIAFFEEDPFELESLARDKGVTVIVDCGVAPGMSNILSGYADSQLDSADNLIIYVGGLPRERTWPFEYKAVFSPIDVIEVYLRPARVLENGEFIAKTSLTERELISFPEVGTVEAFTTDGIRTLARTISAPNQKEKTLRYPGHAEKIDMLREMGLFSKDEVQVGDKNIRPIDLTTQLLFPLWKFKEGDEDVTIMRVVVQGTKDNKKVEYRYDMIDQYDRDNKIHSMARTTGYTATVVARMLLDDAIPMDGLVLPEYLGKDSHLFHSILEQLKSRHGIIYKEKIVDC